MLQRLSSVFERLSQKCGTAQWYFEGFLIAVGVLTIIFIVFHLVKEGWFSKWNRHIWFKILLGDAGFACFYSAATLILLSMESNNAAISVLASICTPFGVLLPLMLMTIRRLSASYAYNRSIIRGVYLIATAAFMIYSFMVYCVYGESIIVLIAIALGILYLPLIGLMAMCRIPLYNHIRSSEKNTRKH